MSRPQTLSTVSYVVLALRAKIKDQYPEYYSDYSQELSYPFSEATERANDNSIKNTGFPLLAYNRSPLRPSNPLGQRGNRFSAYANNPDNTNSDVVSYRTAHCEFDFNFTIVDKNVETIESFELDYMSKEGLGRVTELDVDFSPLDLGTLKYYINWQPDLNSFITNTTENNYSSISGSALIKGWFVSLLGTTPIIKNILTSLNNSVTNFPIETISNP